jgi:hypothetical protein
MSDDEMIAMARTLVAKADLNSKEPTWLSHCSFPPHLRLVS